MNEKQMNEFRKFKYENFGISLNSEQSAIAERFWQAAIASVVVELPTLIIDEYDNGETLEYVEMSELKESLTEAGIRYE